MADDNTSGVSAGDKFMRDWLGLSVAAFAFITVIVLAVFSLRFTYVLFNSKEGYEKGISSLQYIYGALLPLIATWMGTVLAFYFGSKNFEAANKSLQDSNKNLQEIVKTNSTGDDKLKSTKVTDTGVMTEIKDIYYNKDLSAKKDSEILIKADLIDFIDTSKKGERLPIIDGSNLVKYIFHKSTLTDFIYKFANNTYPNLSTKTIATLTLDDAINNSDTETKDRFTRGVAFIAKTATLFDANQQIVSDTYCQDVFVTDTGKASEPIVGWITNNKIAELGKV